MDLLELDGRLEKDIKHLEKSLIDYEKLMKEASMLKYTFENQTKELLDDYGKKIEQLNEKFVKSEALSLLSARSCNDEYYQKFVALYNDMESKKNVFEVYINQMTEAYEEKWQDIQVQNENNRSVLDGKVYEVINKLEADNKRTWIDIVNAQTVHKKETLPSKKEVTEGISDEIDELLGKNRVIEGSIETINNDMCKLKSDSERSLINLSAELFKETTRAEEKDRKLAKSFKIFMVISSILFIVLLIWR